MTFQDSIIQFCSVTGMTPEQVRNNPVVRGEWSRWDAQHSALFGDSPESDMRDAREILESTKRKLGIR